MTSTPQPFTPGYDTRAEYNDIRERVVKYVQEAGHPVAADEHYYSVTQTREGETITHTIGEPDKLRNGEPDAFIFRDPSRDVFLVLSGPSGVLHGEFILIGEDRFVRATRFAD